MHPQAVLDAVLPVLGRKVEGQRRRYHVVMTVPVQVLLVAAGGGSEVMAGDVLPSPHTAPQGPCGGGVSALLAPQGGLIGCLPGRVLPASHSLWCSCNQASQ